MFNVFISVSALLLSVFILLVGHGLQLTLAPLMAQGLGWSTSLIGYTGSSYFLGFVIGCLTVPRLVSQVGHVRVFTVLAASATSALLLLGLFDRFEVWMVARLTTGWAMAGIYMVIESWLNERTSTENRGLVLSAYTTLTLASMCFGQLLIGVGLENLQLILLAAILLSLGMIPVGLTSSPVPTPIPKVGFQFKEVYKGAHIAVGGAVVGGLVTSGFWVLGPIVAAGYNLTPGQIGIFLSVTLLGGALTQLPVGRLSDHYDRRLVLASLTGTGAVVCLLAIWFSKTDPLLLYLFMFLFGGTTFPIYAISLAHANDHTSLPLIETGSVVLMLHSLGSVIGPVVIAQFIQSDKAGLFIFSALALLAFSAWSVWRLRTHKAPRHHFEPFPDVPKTTHEVMAIHEPDREADNDHAVEKKRDD
jgi:MFS family permease